MLEKMAERGKTWSDAETAKLMEAWSKRTIQSHLLGSKRNTKAFEKIVQVLLAHNYERTAKQCRDKFKPLKKHYKDVIDKNRKSGEGKDLPWFDAIHDVMKDRAVTNPSHVIDSSNTQQQMFLVETVRKMSCSLPYRMRTHLQKRLLEGMAPKRNGFKHHL